MGCGKSKHANVAAGNTVVTKKNNTTSSSLTTSVSENVVVEKKIETAKEEEVVVVVAPVVADEKVEEANAAAVAGSVVVKGEVVNDEIKVESESLKIDKVAEPVVEEAATVVQAAEESQPKIVASEESEIFIENPLPDVTQAAVASDESNTKPEATEAVAAVEPKAEAAAEETKTTSEDVQPEELEVTATTADESKTASEITQCEETEAAAEESK